jgi:ribose transport system substrate-binding protein
MRAVRTLVVFVALLSAIAATSACPSSGRAGQYRPTAWETPTVALLVAATKLNCANEMMDGFQTGVQSVSGVRSTVEGPPTIDGPQEARIFKKLTTQARDGIAVFSRSPQLVAAPVNAAVRDGVPVIAVGDQPSPYSGMATYVGNDNYELGRMLADKVADRLPPGATGDIIVGSPTPGAPALNERARGVRDRLVERLPRIAVLGLFDTKEDIHSNRAAWTALVQANPDTLAFIGTGDADGWNLAAIRRDTRGTWLAGGFDVDPQSLLAVRSNELLLVSPECFMAGMIAGMFLARHARDGLPLPAGWLYHPGLVVDASNVEKVLARQASAETKAAWFAAQADEVLNHPERHLRPLPHFPQ